MTSFSLPNAQPAGQSPVAAIDVLQLITDPVICTDAVGRVLLFNRAAEESFGYKTAEVLGESVSILLPLRHRARHTAHVEAFGLGKDTANRMMGDYREVVGCRKNGEEFAGEATISRHLLDGRTILTVVHRDVTARKAQEEQREAIAQELDHRIKNVLAVVSAIVALTAKNALSVQEFRDSLQERLIGLAATQTFLARGKGANAELVDLIGAELAPYQRLAGTNFSIAGLSLALRPSAIQPLALVIHELATNSAKYGAFSQPGGRVSIWVGEHGAAGGRQFAIDWRETGGPPVRLPERQGFGTLLIEQMIKRVFRGEVAFEYPQDGLICRMLVPAAALEETGAATARTVEREEMFSPGI